VRILRIPLLAGIPLHAWLGMKLLLLIILQVAIARGIIKIPFVWHRIFGYVILVIAIIHAIMGLGLMFGNFTIG